LKNISNKEFRYDVGYELLMKLKNYELTCDKEYQSKDHSQY
jgi:hypothetical protein